LRGELVDWVGGVPGGVFQRVVEPHEHLLADLSEELLLVGEVAVDRWRVTPTR
jgi:hypothetical protein